MNILLIEDDKKKAQDICDFVKKSFYNLSIKTKGSYQSGIRELIASSYDLLLLDMSIPTWDKSINEPGGSFEKFGGYKVLKESKRKNRMVSTILITMFEDFGSANATITLNDIDKELRETFSPFYKGFVFYNAREDNWKHKLQQIINSLKEEE